MSNPYDPNAPQDPAQPPYGQPAQPGPTPYGQPAQPPYGQSPYGQSPYGGGYGQPGQEPAGKGMAISALVLSILACGLTNLVSTVLAIVVLRRSKDGRDHGKGLAIAALIINALAFIGIALLVVLITVGVVLSGETVDNLEEGQCITAEGLTGDGDSVSQIEIVGCDGSHDGEVVATTSLSAAEAESYDINDDEQLFEMCTAIIDPAMAQSFTQELAVLGLTQTASPDAGDEFVCIVISADGSKLTEKLG